MSLNLCNFNFSYVIINYKFNDLVHLDKEKGIINGKLALPLYYLLGKNKKCTLVTAEDESNKNGSISYAYKMLEDKKADLILLAQPYYFQPEKLVQFSSTVHTERYVISHPIKKMTSFKSNVDLIQGISLDFKYFLIYLISNFLIYLFIFIQVKIVLKKKFRIFNLTESFLTTFTLILKSIKTGFQNFKFVQIPFLSFIIFNIYILAYFTELFIGNSFKTSKIIFDTNEIIYDENSLYSNDKFVCWISSEPSYNLAINSPANSLLEKILRLKSKEKCVFEQDSVSLETINKFQTNGFILSAYFFAFVLISSLISIERKVFWISDDFYNLPISYLYRRSLEIADKNLINKITSFYLEHGHQLHIYRYSILLIENHDSLKNIFESLDKFKKMNTKFYPIDFQSLKFSIDSLIIIELIICSIFLFDILYRNLKIYLIKRKFGYYFF